jgi:hypothetical protein
VTGKGRKKETGRRNKYRIEVHEKERFMKKGLQFSTLTID